MKAIGSRFKGKMRVLLMVARLTVVLTIMQLQETPEADITRLNLMFAEVLDQRRNLEQFIQLRRGNEI